MSTYYVMTSKIPCGEREINFAKSKAVSTLEDQTHETFIDRTAILIRSAAMLM